MMEFGFGLSLLSQAAQSQSQKIMEMSFPPVGRFLLPELGEVIPGRGLLQSGAGKTDQALKRFPGARLLADLSPGQSLIVCRLGRTGHSLCWTPEHFPRLLPFSARIEA